MDKQVVNVNDRRDCDSDVSDIDLVGYEHDRDRGLFKELGLVDGDFVAYQEGNFVGSSSDRVTVERKIEQIGLRDYSIIRVSYPPTPCLSFHRTFLRRV